MLITLNITALIPYIKPSVESDVNVYLSPGLSLFKRVSVNLIQFKKCSCRNELCNF